MDRPNQDLYVMDINMYIRHKHTDLHPNMFYGEERLWPHFWHEPMVVRTTAAMIYTHRFVEPLRMIIHQILKVNAAQEDFP